MIDSLPRSCLRSVTPYLPGKPIAEVQRELGIKKVYKLASNENPLGASPKALAALRASIPDMHLYPEGSSPLLRRALARHHGVLESQLVVGNGSDEIIRLLCEAFLTPDDEVVASQYAFIRFKQQSMLMGAKVIEVPMASWKHDLTTMAKTVSPRTKLVFVASPNNPTGTYNTRDELADLLKALPSSALLVVDEAYYQYARVRRDYPDTIGSFLPRHPNLVVLRTFSKAYGLAGLRVGYGVADPEIIGWLDRIRMPFNVSLPAQRAAEQALKDVAFVRKSISMTEKNRRTLAARLERDGFRVLESAANFVCAKCPMPGRTLFKKLLREGVIVRPLDEYGLQDHVRISVGDSRANAALFAALTKIAKEPA